MWTRTGTLIIFAMSALALPSSAAAWFDSPNVEPRLEQLDSNIARVEAIVRVRKPEFRARPQPTGSPQDRMRQQAPPTEPVKPQD